MVSIYANHDDDMTVRFDIPENLYSTTTYRFALNLITCIHNILTTVRPKKTTEIYHIMYPSRIFEVLYIEVRLISNLKVKIDLTKIFIKARTPIIKCIFFTALFIIIILGQKLSFDHDLKVFKLINFIILELLYYVIFALAQLIVKTQ